MYWFQEGSEKFGYQILIPKISRHEFPRLSNICRTVNISYKINKSLPLYSTLEVEKLFLIDPQLQGVVDQYCGDKMHNTVLFNLFIISNVVTRDKFLV